jgi:hypothetical protein
MQTAEGCFSSLCRSAFRNTIELRCRRCNVDYRIPSDSSYALQSVGRSSRSARAITVNSGGRRPSAIDSTIRGDRKPSRICRRTDRRSKYSRLASSSTDATVPAISSFDHRRAGYGLEQSRSSRPCSPILHSTWRMPRQRRTSRAVYPMSWGEITALPILTKTWMLLREQGAPIFCASTFHAFSYEDSGCQRYEGLKNHFSCIDWGLLVRLGFCSVRLRGWG